MRITYNVRMALYGACQYFARANAPDELEDLIDDVRDAVYLKTVKELRHIVPRRGQTRQSCIEALACLRTQDEYRRLETSRESLLRNAQAISPTDLDPDGDGAELALDDDGADAERSEHLLDSLITPAWQAEVRRVMARLGGMERALCRAIIAEHRRAGNRVSHRRIRRRLRLGRKAYLRLWDRLKAKLAYAHQLYINNR